MELSSIVVGINVSKEQLSIVLHPTKEERLLPHTAKSITTLVEDLITVHPRVIALESTGGDEWPLTRALLKTMLPVMLVSPSCIRNFALTTGIVTQETLFFSMTGVLEAHLLAQFVSTLRAAV